MEPTVLLVEGNELLRKGLSCRIAEGRRIRRIAEASTPQQALEVVERDRIDVAVIGLDHAGTIAWELVELLADKRDQTRFVVITQQDVQCGSAPSKSARVLGMLGAESSAEELLEAIECAAAGRHYLSPVLERRLSRGSESDARAEAAPCELLTDREMTVLRLIGEGETNRAIAARLGVSPRTVDTHRLKVMRKLGIHKTAGLVRKAIREGLVEL